MEKQTLDKNKIKKKKKHPSKKRSKKRRNRLPKKLYRQLENYADFVARYISSEKIENKEDLIAKLEAAQAMGNLPEVIIGWHMEQITCKKVLKFLATIDDQVCTRFLRKANHTIYQKTREAGLGEELQQYLETIAQPLAIEVYMIEFVEVLKDSIYGIKIQIGSNSNIVLVLTSKGFF